MFRPIKTIFVALIVLIMMGGVYAFAAANTLPASTAGAASVDVPAFIVTNLIYDLNATDPQIVDEITFDVTPESGTTPALTVKVRTDDTTAVWEECTEGEEDVNHVVHVVCDYTDDPALLLADIVDLNIVASSTTDPAP
jgi:archaellin